MGLLVFSIALVGGQRLLGQAEQGTPVWSAARDLPSGTELTAEDLTTVRVRLAPEVAAAYLGTDTELVGGYLTRPLRTGELLPAAAISAGGPSLGAAITIPIDPEHAVGGDLTAGDLVDIYATFDARAPEARTILIARAEVVALVRAEGFVSQSSITGITLSADPNDMPRLAFAVRTADLDVVLIGASAQVSGPREIKKGDF